MEQLHAMAIYNNTVELAGSVFWYVLLSLSRTFSRWISAEAAAELELRQELGSGPKKHHSFTPLCPEKPPGNVCCQREQARRKKAEQEGGKKEEAAEKAKERRVEEGLQRLSGTFLIMFQQDKSHPVAV